MSYPFENTEAEHNKFCDSMKCKHGNYCSFVLGLCHQCKEEIKERI